MDYNPPGSPVHGNSPGKNIGVGCHALLQGNLPNPGVEPRSSGFLHCRWILYHLSHLGIDKLRYAHREKTPMQKIIPFFFLVLLNEDIGYIHSRKERLKINAR